jgi:hypothetical protein
LGIEVVEFMGIVGEVIKLALHAPRGRVNLVRHGKAPTAKSQLELPVALADSHHPPIRFIDDVFPNGRVRLMKQGWEQIETVFAGVRW